jgi:PKD repeat protein
MQLVDSFESGAIRRKYDRKGIIGYMLLVFLMCVRGANTFNLIKMQKQIHKILFILCMISVFPNFAFAAITLSQKSPVPALSDETATYSFTSSATGTIVYGGSCGNADKNSAIAGENRVTWTLADGVYSNCTITVKSGSTASNTLSIPKFESTSKYPVVFVHGLFGNSRAWSSAKSYLTSQGWKSELLIANSITESNSTMCGTASPKQAQQVAGWVDSALAKYPGFEKVDLVGHSRGGNNIMRGLWHGYINHTKVRQVVTMSGANRDCDPYYPAIPNDETPGAISYSVYYSDGTPDNDSAVDYRNTQVTDAFHENLYPLNHSEMKSDSKALSAMKKSLLGQVGSIPPDTGSLTAIITTTSQQGVAPLSLTFNGTKSIGSINSYNWIFGDGKSATGATASHIYQLPGTYTATLVVANTSGQSNQSSITITASQSEPPPPIPPTPPTVVISSSNAVGVAPFTVQFDGSGSTSAQPPITSYSWTFGDGGSAKGAVVSHTFTVTGTYNTTLSVTDSAEMTNQKSTPVIISAPVPVNQKPVSSFAATLLSGNAPLKVSFNGSGSKDPDGSIKNYTWSFGQGATANGVSVEHTYTEVGDYSVSLLVTDDKGATAISSQTISVFPPQEIDFELMEVQADHNWAQFTFSKPFINPIVVAGPPGYADADPATIRIRNVTSTGFEVRIQEWDYLNEKHNPETFSFIVMEKGIYTLSNGTKIEAGSFTGSKLFQKISLQQSYALTPVVLTQVTTYNESDAVTGRIRNGNQSSFEYRLQEQENNRNFHKPETISYIAWEPGKGEYAGLLYESGFINQSVTHKWFDFSFETKFSEQPLFIAGMQTATGDDTAALRCRNLSQTAVQLQVEEEQSKDRETRHAAETVGYLSIIALP